MRNNNHFIAIDRDTDTPFDRDHHFIIRGFPSFADIIFIDLIRRCVRHFVNFELCTQKLSVFDKSRG